MLPLLRKKAETAAVPQTPAWHPNFRNYEKLPDIKAVRTVFFVNVGAITTVILFLGIVGHQEYKLININRQIEATQIAIDRDRKVSDQAIKTFNQFKEEEKKLLEIDAFLKSRPVISPLLIHIGQEIPKNIALTLFDLKEKGLTLRGVVRGAPELASGTANSYVEQLRKDKAVMDIFPEISLTNLSRDPTTGRLLFELYLKLKSDKPEKK